MNVLDYVFLAIIVVFLFWGLFRGLAKEVITTAGVLAAYWVANSYYQALAPEFHYWLSSPAFMSMAAYFALFTGTFVLSWLLSYIVLKVFRIMPPAWIEFPGGAVFGACKGVLICAMALVSLNSFMPDATWVEQSRLAARLQPLTKVLERFAPGHMTSYDPSILSDKLMQDSEEFRAKFLGQGADAADDMEEQAAKKAEQAREEEKKGVPAEVLEMKDKILKGVRQMMNKDTEEKQ